MALLYRFPAEGVISLTISFLHKNTTLFDSKNIGNSGNEWASLA